MLENIGHPGNFIKPFVHRETPPRPTTNQRTHRLPSGGRWPTSRAPLSQRSEDSTHATVAHKPHTPLRTNLVHVKDPFPTLQRSKSSIRSCVRVVTEHKQDKRVAFSGKCSRNTGALSRGTTQNRMDIVWTRVTSSTGKTLVSSHMLTRTGNNK